MKSSKLVGVAAIAAVGVTMVAGYAPFEENADAKTPPSATHEAPPENGDTVAGWSKPPIMPPSMRPADHKP